MIYKNPDSFYTRKTKNGWISTLSLQNPCNSIIILWFWRMSFKISCASFFHPWNSSFLKRVLWLTRSKALFKSVGITTTYSSNFLNVFMVQIYREIFCKPFPKNQIFYFACSDPKSIQNPKCYISLESLYNFWKNVHLRILDLVLRGQ